MAAHTNPKNLQGWVRSIRKPVQTSCKIPPPVQTKTMQQYGSYTAHPDANTAHIQLILMLIRLILMPIRLILMPIRLILRHAHGASRCRDGSPRRAPRLSGETSEYWGDETIGETLWETCWETVLDWRLLGRLLGRLVGRLFRLETIGETFRETF